MTKRDILNLADKAKANKEKIRQVLVENGYDAKQESFKDLILAIEKMYILNPNRQHTFVVLDEYGYIQSAIDFNCEDLIFDQGNFPEDLLDGYYKLQDGNIVRDESRKEELYSID